MDPIKPKFYHSAFTIAYDGMSLELSGLISIYGITKIFLKNGLDPSWRPALGKSVNVDLGSFQTKGVLTQQIVEHGSHLHIHFADLKNEHKAFIEQKIHSDGVSPGWKRKFPRIPITGAEDPDLPIPNLCLVKFIGQEFFVNVINFTLGGLRIETIGDNLSELRVGAVIHFDLISTSGEIFTNLSAEVRNMSVNENHGEAGASFVTRSFGLKFNEPLDPVNDRRYKNLIKDYCTILLKKFKESDK
ncbi:MAG: PilZ domain-containing protein [Oligoflexia bacterium]|nr:PilZ domain-containing protein [Oligoflexia bacterium]